ncbi:hypothetical protein K8I28_09640 [bacterium]|nr:hypothetical protein [bacterium]
MSVPMIAGLYQRTRGGKSSLPSSTLHEIRASLKVNPEYRDRMIVLAADDVSARQLSEFEIQAHRIFTDAPEEIHLDAVHKMKHWMCLWALKEYGEFLWVDWDTVMLRVPDLAFWAACRKYKSPKFIWIKNYWATVNCGVYYACKEWIPMLEKSLSVEVSEPNDELLWAAVLPKDVRNQKEFWWDGEVAHVWSENDFKNITPQTFFAHVRFLGWAQKIRNLIPDDQFTTRKTGRFA